jgi:L-lactate dehydrogenase (cytochrome)
MQKYKFPPAHPGGHLEARAQSTTILGEPAALPLILAPIGSGGFSIWTARSYACRAAQKVGIPYTLSTMSICSIEDVAANVDKPFWFQLYMMKDRGFAKALIERAIAAKCSALVLTVDLQVLGQRHADVKNGLTVPPETRDAEKPDRLRDQAALGHGHAAARAGISATSPAM